MKKFLFSTVLIFQFVSLFGHTNYFNSLSDRSGIDKNDISFYSNNINIPSETDKNISIKLLDGTSNGSIDYIEIAERIFILPKTENNTWKPDLSKIPISPPPPDSLTIYFTAVPINGGIISGDNFTFDMFTGTGDGNFANNNGIKKSFIAIPNSGCKLSYWSNIDPTDTVRDAQGNPILGWFHPRDVVTESNNHLTAHFNYIVNATPNISGGGTISGIGNFASGTGDYAPGITATLTATPSSGYEFVNWSEGSVPISNSLGLSITVNNPRTLVANFKFITYNITITSNPAVGGSSSGSGSYNQGATANLNATPAYGYAFVNWTDGNTIVSTSQGFSLTVDKDKTLSANFIQQFIITVVAFPSSGGSTSPDGADIYDVGTVVPLMANPAAGYRFVNWTEDGVQVSTSQNISVIANKDRTLRANFIKQFNIIASSVPATGGSVTGSGIYDINSPVTLTASPVAGYTFVNWTEGGTILSSNSSISFSATTDRTIQANFIQKFTITAIASTGGSVSGSGIYNSGATVSLTATPASGYIFANWTEGGTVVSTSSVYSFTADKDRTLQANFVQKITITTNSTVGGSASGSGIYDVGAAVVLAATAVSGYVFANWTEGGTVVSTSAAYSFTADRNRTLQANFIQRFTITANASTGGSATGSGIYDAGTTVALTSTPASGYVFVNWTEGGTVVSTSAAYSFTADKDRTLQANFVQRFIITANASTSGSAIGSGIYDAGAAVTLTATPASGYAFVNWTESGTVVSSNSAYSFTADKDRTLQANFIQRFTITTTSTVGGSATGSGVYDAGTAVTLSSTPLAGFAFVNWTESGTVVSTSSAYSFTADKDRTLQANFIQRFSISATASPSIGGSATGSGIYDAGSAVALSATPLAGFAFVNWTEGGTVVSTSLSYSFTADKDRTLQANFIQRFTITATSTVGGSATGSGIYDAGSAVSLTATPIAGYAFVNWTEGGTVVSTSSAYSFTADKDRTLQANFIQRFTITTTSTVGGLATGSGIYDAGSAVALSATPLAGFAFVNWTEGGTVVSTSSSYSFTADKDRTLQANFIQRFSISATVSPSIGGSASGSGIYDAGSAVPLTATAAMGYAFVNWTEGGTVVSTSSSYSFTADKDRTLQANFIQRFTITATVSPSIGGSATGSGIYDAGTAVTLSSTPLAGFAFVNWTEGGTVVSTSSAYSFTADKDRTLIANFIQRFSITAAANPSVGGSVSGSGIYDAGSSVALSATPLTGYAFVSWTEGGTVVSTSSAYSFTADKDRTLLANFKLKTFIITATALPSGGGTISDGINSATPIYNKTFSFGNNIKLTAVPTLGYEFVNWTENGTSLNVTSLEYSFVADKVRDIIANFIKKSYTIKATSNPTDGGTISIAGYGTGTATFSATYMIGDEVKLSANHTPCFEFESWTEGNAIVSLNSNYTFTATGNRTLTANFKLPTTLKIKTSDSICMGEALNFEVISDKSKDKMIWDLGDGTTLTGSEVKHTFTSTGFFKVTVKSSDAPLCPVSTYKIIKVYTSLNLNLKDTTGCSPFHLSISTSSKKEKILWNFGDDNTWYSKCDKVYVNKEDKPIRRKITVVSDNDHGCNTTSSFYVTINPSPKCGIEYYTKPGRPEILVYKNKSILSDSCDWELPDGTHQINKDSIIQQYKQNGLYRILLKSTNKYGCIDTTSISHRTIFTGLYVPNAFRPESQDHKVNCFRPIGTGIKSFQMGIYDLWGNLVWQAKTEGDLESFEGWNGKSKNGTPLPVGVYIWRIKAVFQDGTEWKGTPDEKGKCRTEGNITLLR